MFKISILLKQLKIFYLYLLKNKVSISLLINQFIGLGLLRRLTLLENLTLHIFKLVINGRNEQGNGRLFFYNSKTS